MLFFVSLSDSFTGPFREQQELSSLGLNPTIVFERSLKRKETALQEKTKRLLPKMSSKAFANHTYSPLCRVKGFL